MPEKMPRIYYALIIGWLFLAACNRAEIMSDSVYGIAETPVLTMEAVGVRVSPEETR